MLARPATTAGKPVVRVGVWVGGERVFCPDALFPPVPARWGILRYPADHSAHRTQQ